MFGNRQTVIAHCFGIYDRNRLIMKMRENGIKCKARPVHNGSAYLSNYNDVFRFDICTKEKYAEKAIMLLENNFPVNVTSSLKNGVKLHTIKTCSEE